MWHWIKEKWSALEGYRTIIINVAIAGMFLLAELAAYLAIVDWREIVPEKYAPLVVVALNLLNIALRFITKGPTPLAHWRDK